jgi:uncharacterized protein YbbC (DUF1343 family)
MHPARHLVEPTFHKHVSQMCSGVHIHAEANADHGAFRPWRLQALAFKAIRTLFPGISCGAVFLMNMHLREAADRRDQRLAPVADRFDDRSGAG